MREKRTAPLARAAPFHCLQPCCAGSTFEGHCDCLCSGCEKAIARGDPTGMTKERRNA